MIVPQNNVPITREIHIDENLSRCDGFEQQFVRLRTDSILTFHYKDNLENLYAEIRKLVST